MTRDQHEQAIASQVRTFFVESVFTVPDPCKRANACPRGGICGRGGRSAHFQNVPHPPETPAPQWVARLHVFEVTFCRQQKKPGCSARMCPGTVLLHIPSSAHARYERQMR